MEKENRNNALELSDINSTFSFKDATALIKNILESSRQKGQIKQKVLSNSVYEPNISIGIFEMIKYKYTEYKNIANLVSVVLVSLIKVRLMDKNNWKTTVGAVVAAIGIALSSIEDPAWLKLIGQLLTGTAIIFFGYNTKDK